MRASPAIGAHAGSVETPERVLDSLLTPSTLDLVLLARLNERDYFLRG